jgi:hypothetical protein
MLNIQDEIRNFNLKKNEIIKLLIDNQIIKTNFNISEIPYNEINFFTIKNIIYNIKNELCKLKQQITETSNFINLLPNRYIKQFNNSDNIFWGIGLENETYLQGKPKLMLGKDIIKNLGRERYSVDYTTNYDIEQVKQVMRQVYLPNNLYEVSQMVNANSFTKMDINKQHLTTYEKEPKPNPKFKGKTVIEEWYDYDTEIKTILNSQNKTDSNIFFDGDTIEFITENFYKNNTEIIVKELNDCRNNFLDKFNKFKKDTNLWNELGEITFPNTHSGINIFNSHSNKIVFFNNTTFHLHLTLPTEMRNGLIIDEKIFVEKHAKAIKLIQWFEPFFISTLGSPDLLQLVFEKYQKIMEKKEIESKNYFACGSMRIAISRYISVGTFNPDTMIMGKLLTDSVDELRPKNIVWWRDMIAEDLLYNLPKNEIGYDFNYGKHYQSGLELRFFDGFPINILKDVLDIIILICEHSYSFINLKNIEKSSTSQIWNNLIYKSIVYGYKGTINKNEMNDVIKILNINIIFTETELTIEEFYFRILEHLFLIYSNKETHVIKYLTKNFNKINRWENFNKKQHLEHIKSLNNINS